MVRLSHLGDVVCALGVFHALHEAFPAAEIGWAVQPEFAGLLEGLPGLERIFRFERHGGLAGWRRLVREVRRFGPELTVDAQGNLKSASVTAFTGAPRRIGLARADWREKLGALAVNERAPACPPGALHAMDRMLGLVRHLVPAVGRPRFDAGLTPAELTRGEDLLHEYAPAETDGKHTVVLHLSSVEDVRSWPVERWEGLIHELREAGKSCVVLSGPKEEREGRLLAERLPAGPDLVHWIGQEDLRELAAFFTAAGARDWRLVACDSGPMHLAWASGMAVVVLEGPQDAARTGPWPFPDGTPHRAVVSARPPPCAPCFARRCTYREGPTCMTTIEPSQVVAALRSSG